MRNTLAVIGEWISRYQLAQPLGQRQGQARLPRARDLWRMR